MIHIHTVPLGESLKFHRSIYTSVQYDKWLQWGIGEISYTGNTLWRSINKLMLSDFFLGSYMLVNAFSHSERGG